eukprot:406054_1
MAEDVANVPTHKIVVLGSGGVGKSCMTLRYISDAFVEDYDPTIEESFTKQVEIDGQSCMLEVLDTAGQEQFASMQDNWMYQGDGFLLVYSITDPTSFPEIEDLREKILRVKDDDENTPIVVVANKVDLEDQRKVDKSKGVSTCAQWRCPFYETSAKEKINHTICFETVVRRIRQYKPAKPVEKKKK